MFARSPLRYSAGCRPRLRPSFRAGHACPTAPLRVSPVRRFSMHSSGTATAPQAGNFSGALAPFVGELDRIAPNFEIEAGQIRVLRSPAEFYETLKTKIRGARKRVFLSTLYIGKTETELIETLRGALRRNPDLKVSILTDALRGTREAPEPSCASLLAPLVEEFGAERVEIRMYHTPNLTGLKKKCVPTRINEGWGLQHMKLYGVDDEIIISGANLSTDYFTNRQDRYHLFSCKEIVDFFWRVQEGVQSLSFLVAPSKEPAGFELTWPKSNGGPSPLENPTKFTKHASSVLGALILPSPKSKDKDTKVSNTRVYMLSQMSQLLRPDTSTELPALTHILKELSKPKYSTASWTFTAGYFNPAPSLTKMLLSTATNNNTVITASPWANGFYKSPGVSGLLPDAYTDLVRRFLRAVHARKRDSSITVKEWRQGTAGEPNAWTYHAKGLWVTLPNESNPSISLVGSSNYTKRSYSLDLEVGALIVTEDEGLKKRLGEEQMWLQEFASRITRDDLATNERRVGLKVRVAMWIVRAVGGAL